MTHDRTARGERRELGDKRMKKCTHGPRNDFADVATAVPETNTGTVYSATAVSRLTYSSEAKSLYQEG